MKKNYILILAPILILASCGGSNSSLDSITSIDSSEQSISSIESTSSEVSTSSEEKEEITATLKEVMDVYRQKGNYTYIVDDEVFNVTTTLRYTKNAYYYQPSTEKHGGSAIGYAENDTGVFSYTIENGTVKMGQYLTDNNGNYIHQMWAYVLPSFFDIVISALPDEGTDNLYEITDANNKLLISGLCGYGDLYVQSYLKVYIELTSNTTFRTIVNTDGLSEGYKGNIYGELSDIGTTTIPEIERALANNEGPELLDEALIDILKKLVNSKNYTIEINSANNYVDKFTKRNYYSQNLTDDEKSIGYAGSPDGVFKYTIKDNEVVAGQVIQNVNGVYDSIWNNLPNFYNFSTLNLSRVAYTKVNNKYVITDSSIIYTFATISHIDEVTAMQEGSSLEITLDNNCLNYSLKIEGLSTITGSVKNIDSTSIPEIEKYISDGNGPLEYEDIDTQARNLLSALNKSKNYTLNIVSTFSSNQFTNIEYFTATSYYQEKNNSECTGYIEKSDGVYSFAKENDALVLKEKVKESGTFLWSSGLFKGLNRLDLNSLNGKKLEESTYSITDNTNKNYLYEIAGFNQYDLMFYVKEVTFKVNNFETKEVTFTIDLGQMGKVTIDVTNVGSTSITNIDTL